MALLQFILGPSGSGKSQSLYQEIKKDLSNSRKVLLLVPEHQVLESEKSLISVLEQTPTLQLEVLSFSRLAQRIFRTLGSMTQKELDRGAQLLVLWRAMQEVAPFLEEFSAASLQEQGFLERTLDTINEFQNNCIMPQNLQTAILHLQDENLRKKLSDFSKIYSSFDAILAQEYQYTGNDLSRAYDLLSENAVFDDFCVYIDSFVGFTAQEYQLIREVMRHAMKTTVALPLLKEDAFFLQEPKFTKERLEKIANKIGVTMQEPIFLEAQAQKNSALSNLAEHLWDMRECQIVFENEEKPRLLIADNSFEEMELVAQKICEEVRNGREYREIAVVSRNLSRYEGVLESVFSEYQIPFFFSERIELQKKPFVRWIQTLLTLIANHFRLQDMMAYLRSSCLQIEPDQYDLLERYVTTWNIQGEKWLEIEPWTMNPEGYTDNVKDNTKDRLERIHTLRMALITPILPLYQALTSHCTVKNAVKALYDLTQTLEIPAQLKKENVAESNLIWNTWMDAIDQLYRVCGDRTIEHPREFLQMLNLILSQSYLRDIPSYVDGVLIGDAAQIQASDVKSAYLIGVVAEQFPANVSTSSLFSSWERKDMVDNGQLEFLQSDDIDVARELYYAYRAVSLPKERLTLSCYTDNGAVPSELFDRVQQYFALDIEISSQIEQNAQIQSKQPAWQYYCANRTSLQGRALERIFEEDVVYQTRLEQLKVFRPDDKISLSDQTTAKLFPQDLSLTQSRLEKFVCCPFAFHCQYTLRLKGAASGRFRASDSGTFLHRLLEKVVAQIQALPNGFKGVTEKTVENLVKSEVQQYLIACCGNQESASVRLQNLFRRLQRTAIVLIQNLVQEFSQSEFYPAFFELPMERTEVENGAKTLEIPLPDGTKATLYGIIDRVDLYEKDHQVYIRVVDYKTGSKDHKLEDIRYGLNLQMLIYFFALWKNPPKILKDRVGADNKTQFLPAGVLYFTAKSPKITSNTGFLSPEAYEELLNIPRIGWVLDDPDVLSAMESDLKGNFIPIKTKKKKDEALKTLEDFGALYRQVCDTVSEIAVQLKKGVADPTPDFIKNECNYCDYQDIGRKAKIKKKNFK